jgi:hypothetical protein
MAEEQEREEERQRA